MHVSEVVLLKNCSMVFDESKFKLQSFLNLSSFVTEIIQAFKVYQACKVNFTHLINFQRGIN